MRVVAALSGGVDSAVAAARVAEDGHDVLGVHLSLHRRPTAGWGCGAPGDLEDARRVAEVLDIPFEVWDVSDEFDRFVVEDFVSGYAAGSTPNPCILCNQRIKFQALEDRGLASGFDAMATGHYARILRSEAEDGVELHRACSLAKDQSYVLAALGIERLARAHFPLGDVRSKSEVRQEARRRGLPVHDRPDSFDACFVADGDLPGFLGRLLGERPGEILDEDGAVVGEHRGAYSFTVGQRKGLRLARPAPDGEPRYVLKVDPATNVVVVGPRASLKARSLTGTGVVWLAPDIPVREPTSCLVQVRAHGVAVSAKVAVEGDLLRVTLDEPMIRVAAGQTIVVYDGTRVLGQATAAEAA